MDRHKLYVHQCTNPIHPQYKMWVVCMPDKGYLHKDGVWRPLSELHRQDENGDWTAYYKEDEISVG